MSRVRIPSPAPSVREERALKPVPRATHKIAIIGIIRLYLVEFVPYYLIEHFPARGCSIKKTNMNTKFTYKGHAVEIVFSGAPGWFDFYVDGKPWGCCRANKIQQRVQEVIALKEEAK